MDTSLYSSLMQDIETNNQNPQQHLSKNYLQSLMSLIPEKQTSQPIPSQTTHQQKIFALIQSILQKPYENRSSQQLSIISSFSKKNKYLKKMQQQIGSDFVKNIMKYATLVILSPGKIICKEKEPITHFYLVLNGKVGLKRTQQVSINVDQPNIYELLTITAKQQAKYINKILKSQKIPVKNFQQLKLEVQEIQQQFYDHVWKNQMYGPFDYCATKMYLNTAIVTQRCTLLQFSIYHFLSYLDRSHKDKMKKQMGLIANIPCFKFVSSSKLQQFLGSMILKKKKRKQFIYKQGDPTQSIFLLIQGQIKITKNTHLFEENPNNFYVNRNKLIDGKENPLDRPEDVLPYANLTRLYNYRPLNKLIQIGVLSPICLFGQQQMIQRRKRQTNAQCYSFEVVYYEIQIKKIQENFGPIIMDQFKIQVKNQIKKKLLYRQNQYANTVQLENNKNLNYFYYEGQKEKQSPRKFNITKINNKLSQKSKQIRPQSLQLPAYYTAFNFHKMSQKAHQKQSKTSRYKNIVSQDQQKVSIDPIEKKLVDISHTWGPIKRRVKQEAQLSKKMSPFKQSIDIQSPLIDQKFFIQMSLENQRIERNYRKKKLNLGVNGKKSKYTIDPQRSQN